MMMNRQFNQMMNTMMMRNPQARQVMQMINAKTPQEQRELAEKLCKERGTTIEEVARSMGIQIPSNR